MLDHNSLNIFRQTASRIAVLAVLGQAILVFLVLGTYILTSFILYKLLRELNSHLREQYRDLVNIARANILCFQGHAFIRFLG
jgi:hypothetical protein